MCFKDTGEVIAGKSVFISDFRHRVIEVFLHVKTPRFIPVGLGDIGDVVLLHFGGLMLPDEVADGLSTHSSSSADLVEGVPLGDVRIVLIGEQAMHHVPVIEAEGTNHVSLDSALLEHGIEPAIGDIVLFHYLFSCHPFAQIVSRSLDGVANILVFCSLGGHFLQVFTVNADGPEREAFQRDVVLLDNLVQGVPRHLEESGGICNGEEVFVEQGETFSLPDIIPKILKPFIAQLVLFAQVCASGGAVASDCEVGFELASALLTNFEVESLRVHRGTCAA